MGQRRRVLLLARRRTCDSEDLTLPRPPDGSHFPAASAAAEERVAAVGLEARHRDAGRHVDLLQNLAALRVDSAQFAFVGFPRAVPEFAIDPRYASDETVRLDGAKDRASLRIDLMDLAFAMLPDPEAPFRPRHPGGATVGCRDGSDHAAGCMIDLLDAVPGDLVQVLAIEGGSRIRRDIERTHRFPARRVDRVQCVASRDPYIGAVIADPMHMRDIWKRAVLADDRRCCSLHAVILATQR